MNFRIHLIFSLFIFPISSYAQSSKCYESNDKTYRVFIPSNWEQKKSVIGNTVFSYSPPDNKKEGFMPTTIELETGTLKESYQNTDIKELAILESEITKNQIGNNILVFRDTFRTINNKLWWEYAFSTKASKKTKAAYYILKTIHNQVTYTLTFSGPDVYFDKYMGKALAHMYSFMFYTKDKTLYKNKVALAPAIVAKSLSTYEGTYKEQNQNFTQVINITNAGNGNYLANEYREFLIDGRKCSFIADLVIEAIDADKITLSSDMVSACDTSIQWAKATYHLNKTATALAGTSSSKGKNFETFPVNFVKQKEAASNIANAVNNDNQGPATSSPANNTAKEYGTSDPETGEINEPVFIKQFGGGKVMRKSKAELIIVTSGGKSISLKDKGGDEDEGQIRYKFLGSIAELNSYVVYQLGMEADSYTLINKINGSIAAIPNLEYVISSDKKWAGVYNNDIINSLEQSFIKVFSVSNTGLKESFSKITLDVQTNKGWGAASLIWIDNNTLEVEKVVADPATEELKPAGKSWLNLQAGKWVLTNTAPKTKKAQAAIVPSSEDYPIDDGTNAGTGKITRVPSSAERIMIGGKTPEELGKILITALKNNDKKTWYGCILNGTVEEANADFDDIKKQFKMQGLTNWNLVKFSRATYSNYRSKTNPDAEIYQYFKVEFLYGSDFIGRIEGRINAFVEVHQKKYVLRESIRGTNLLRKEEYR